MRANIPGCGVQTLAVAGESWWSDYALDYDVTDYGVDDYADVRIGASGSRYRIELLRRPNWVPARVRLWGLAQGPIDYPFDRLFSGATNHVRIEIVGTTLKTYVDNILVFQRTDPESPSTSGPIGVGVNSGAWCSADVRFDNLVVTSLVIDATPPAAVTDLSVTAATDTSLTLGWTAPGSDGNVGTAATYDVRYSTSPITEANWATATQANGEPAPKPAGSKETFTASGVTPRTTYYFALKTADQAPNWSGLSNIATASILNVPVLKQTSLPWRDDPYGQIGKTDPNTDTIARWGCFLTSWSMILDSYGSRYGFYTNPRELNNWLRENGGYKERSLIPAKVGEYALKKTPIRLQPPRMIGRDDRKLGELLAMGIPVDVRVQNRYGEHHVLTVGETTSGASTTWFINDPSDNFSTLRDGYNDSYDLMQWAATADGPAQLASVTLMLGSPAELLVTDPQGRRTGMDPRTGVAYNEIPDAIYFVDSLADDIGTGQIAKPVKLFYWPAPLNGGYTIQVIGTDNGTYTLDALNYSEQGEPASAALSGITKPASVDEYRMDYSSAPGVPVTIRREVRIDIKPGSYPNSINLGSAGTVPVAILSTPTFDATKVDPATVTLAGAFVALKGKGTQMASVQDVDGDGVSDLVVHVSTEALQLSYGDTQAVLDGQTFNGASIRGTDSVRIVP